VVSQGTSSFSGDAVKFLHIAVLLQGEMIVQPKTGSHKRRTRSIGSGELEAV